MRVDSGETPKDETLDELLDGFEESWRCGNAPDIVAICNNIDDQERNSALIDLIKIDLEYRWRQRAEDTGDARSPTDEWTLEWYVEHLSHLPSLSELSAELIRHEYYVRQRWGDRPPISDYQARFQLSPETAESLLSAVEKSIRPHESATIMGSHAPVVSADISFPQISGYEICEKLGQGGMGTVYKARQLDADRTVALKVVRADQLAELSLERRREVVSRFQGEARAAAALDHDHIVTVYDVGESHGRAFYSMRFVEGESLANRLQRGPVPGRDAAEMLEPIARAVQRTHESGILHRDLKPANILVEHATGRPLVTDFGLAKLQNADLTATKTGDVFGSPPYMPPEQAKSAGDATAASDVYSLGATLYHMLTGKPPFQAASVLETLRLVVETEPVPPRELNPAVEKDLETICLKCLEKDPTRRYASAEVLANDLRRFVRMEPIAARPIGRIGRISRWCRRNAFVSSMLTLVIVILATATSVSAYFAVDASEKAELERIERGRADRQAAVADKARASESRRADSEQRAKEKATLALADLAKQKKVTEAALKLSEQARARAEFVVHASRIDAALRLVKNGQLARARDVLLTTDPKLRNWEYSYVMRQTMKLQVDAGGHDKDIESVAFSPDGREVVTASSDGSLKVWDSHAGRLIHTLKGHSDRVCSVAYSADGKSIFSGCWDGSIKIWDTGTGKETKSIAAHAGSVWSLSATRDGKWVVSGSADKTVKVWDAATWKLRHELLGHTDGVRSVSVSGDGTRAVSGGGDRTRLWNIVTGRQIRYFAASGRAVAISPNGSKIAVGGFGTVSVWDSRTGSKLLSVSRHTEAIHALQFSPDGKHIVSACRSIRLSSAIDGDEVLVLKLPKFGGFHNCVRFSDDGKRIVSGGSYGTFQIWDARQHRPNTILETYGHSVALAYSNNGRWILAGRERTHLIRRFPGRPPTRLKLGSLTIRDAKTGHQAFRIMGRFVFGRRVSFTPSGRRIVASRSDGVQIWDLTSNRVPKSIKSYSGTFALSPDGTKVIVARGRDSMTPVIYDVITNRSIAVLKGHSQRITNVGFSSDGKTVISSSLDRSVRFWNAATGKQVGRLHGDYDWAAYTPGERNVLAITPKGRVHICAIDGKTQTELSGVAKGAFAYSPNAKTIVFARGEDSKVPVVFDVRSGAKLLSLKGHTAAVYTVRFNADGSRIFTGGSDGTIRIWDSTTGITALSLDAHARLKGTHAVSDIRFNPRHHQQFVSASTRGSLVLWDGGLGQASQRHSIHVKAIRSVDFGNKAGTIVSASDGRVVVHDQKRGEIHEISDATWPVVAAPNTRQIACAHRNGRVQLCDRETGKRRVLDGRVGFVVDIAFEPRLSRVAAASYSGQTKVWEIRTGDQIAGIKGRCVALGRDGKMIVTGCSDGTVRLWDGSGRPTGVIRAHNEAVGHVAISPDGRFIASSADKIISVWTTSTRELHRELRGHAGRITALQFSSNGRHVVSGSYDSTVRLWGLSDGVEPIVLRGHTGCVWSVAVSSDGKWIASGGDDQSILKWKTEDLLKWASQNRRSRAYRQSLSAIKSLGGRVIGWPARYVFMSGSRVIDAHLVHLEPLKQLRTVTLAGTSVSDRGMVHLKGLQELGTLDLSGTRVTDHGLKQIEGLSNLSILSLAKTVVSDAGATHLTKLPGLRSLDLSGTKITDSGLGGLKRMTKLETLRLNNTSISDAGIVHLATMNKLNWLFLRGTSTSDAGLRHLERLTNLSLLDLGDCKVSDEGIAHLKGLAGLSSLNLSGTKTSDAGIEHLIGLTNLTSLNLDKTTVSDAALRHVKRIKKLRSLSLRDTKITPAALQTLRRELPRCRIIR